MARPDTSIFFESLEIDGGAGGLPVVNVIAQTLRNEN
jgi:hypothetical protein